MLHRERLTPLSFCPAEHHLSACARPAHYGSGALPPVPVISPLEIVVLNQKPEACECGRGLTSPLVLHDLKWAPLHSTTRLGQAAIKRV